MAWNIYEMLWNIYEMRRNIYEMLWNIYMKCLGISMTCIGIFMKYLVLLVCIQNSSGGHQWAWRELDAFAFLGWHLTFDFSARVEADNISAHSDPNTLKLQWFYDDKPHKNRCFCRACLDFATINRWNINRIRWNIYDLR